VTVLSLSRFAQIMVDSDDGEEGWTGGRSKIAPDEKSISPGKDGDTLSRVTVCWPDIWVMY